MDPYKVLGVNENATDAEIKAAYHAAVRKYHPDQYKDNPLSDLAESKMTVMAKEELFRNKFLGGLFRMLGAFPVKRGTGGADALEDAYTLLEENGVVGVFIEGHRSKDGRLLKPKTGAALLAYKTKAPVVPVCITAGDGLQPGMFKRTLIRFGKPISAQELHIQDDSSMQLRRASRTIMGRIAQLREESCKELGLPSQLEPAREAPAQEAPHES